MNDRKGSYNAQDYRYGYNGKENDNEVKGESNQQDYGFRVYDPRVGRFLSVDPLTKDYPMLTPYQFASNMPISAIDIDGLESKLVVHELGANSTYSYTVDLTDPNLNPNDVLYAKQKELGKRGTLTVIKKVGSDDLIEIFEISYMNLLKNIYEGMLDDNYPNSTQRSGINLTSKEGGGPMESRYLPLDGAKSVEISALLTYVNYTKFMNLPTSTLQELLLNPEEIANITNLVKTIVEDNYNKSTNNKNRIACDSSCNSCPFPPHDDLSYTTYDCEGNPINIKKLKHE